MKKRTLNASVIGMILAAVCVIVVVLNLTDIAAHGSIDKSSEIATINNAEHEGTEVTGYDLVVIEEEQLPAAAAPEENKSSHAIWVIAIVSILVVLIGYELWFENCNLRIITLAEESGELGYRKGVGRLHPFKAMDARRELESRAAEHYFR